MFAGNSKRVGKGSVERAVAYIRLGRHEYGGGHRLDTQRERVTDYAHREGIWLMAVYEDRGVSGSTPLAARPGMSQALEVVRARAADILLVARRDRIASDPLVGALIEREFEQAGGRVVYAEGGMEDGSQNQPMREVLDSVAEYERASLVARLTAARAAKKARGGYAGGRPPFGYRAHGKALVPNEEQAAACAGSSTGLRGTAGRRARSRRSSTRRACSGDAGGRRTSGRSCDARITKRARRPHESSTLGSGTARTPSSPGGDVDAPTPWEAKLAPPQRRDRTGGRFCVLPGRHVAQFDKGEELQRVLNVELPKRFPSLTRSTRIIQNLYYGLWQRVDVFDVANASERRSPLLFVAKGLS